MQAMDGLRISPTTRPPLGIEAAHARPVPASTVYLLEALASVGTNLLISGIYFYMTSRYGWGLLQNFLLASVQGVVYVVGALSAHAIRARLGTRRSLWLMYGVLAALSLFCLAVHSAAAVTAILLAYTALSVITWPILEGLISHGLDSYTLSRRISHYNLVWAGVGATALAVDGAVIQHWPQGVFLIPAIVHIAGMALVPLLMPGEINAQPAPAAAAAPQAAPELLNVRTLALWLSRVALPATYVVIYGLMSLMPSLPALHSLDTSAQTAMGSIWMVGRWATFLLLGLGTWWHARPRVLLIAAIAMLVAFLGVTIRPSDLFGHGSQLIDLISLGSWQLLLGASLGIIYAGSLYFGMVLSHGSTEHGGYHEALIGLGMVLGPGAGAAAQAVHPGSTTGILAVGAVIALSVAAATVTSIVGAKRR
jgi:hypothetical protein